MTCTPLVFESRTKLTCPYIGEIMSSVPYLQYQGFRIVLDWSLSHSPNYMSFPSQKFCTGQHLCLPFTDKPASRMHCQLAGNRQQPDLASQIFSGLTKSLVHTALGFVPTALLVRSKYEAKAKTCNGNCPQNAILDSVYSVYMKYVT